MKTAVIDIGSNSVRLMLWADGKSLYKKVKTTRLGEGLQSSGSLSSAAMERTAEAVRAFCEEGKRVGAQVRAFGTAAVRNGANAGDFIALIWRVCGLKVDVVSGEEEALLGALGALGEEDGALIDIGGASTELFARKEKRTVLSQSIPIGAVRLYDACKDVEGAAEAFIQASLGKLAGEWRGGTVYAVGGTASTLACIHHGIEGYDGAVLQGELLPREWVEEMAHRLFSLPQEERLKIRGMDPHRADILGGATLLLARIMKKLSVPAVRFSGRDNLEGYLTLRGLA